MTTLPDLDRLHAKVSATPVTVRRRGFAVNIGGAQGGGEPLGAPRIEDLWEIADAYPALRAYVAALERLRAARPETHTHLNNVRTCELCDAIKATDAARAQMEKQDG